MGRIFGNIEEILDCHVNGFHQYILQGAAHLVFASRSFCDMLGCSQDELLSEERDMYADFVHPADAEIYADFIKKLSEKEQKLTVCYRVIGKDGAVKHVSDTAVSRRTQDGVLCANAVIADITPIKAENENLRFLNETIPCGFLRYTCEKSPKITYINDRMQKLLRIPEVRDGEMDYLEMYKDNIYLMIPMEDRRRFSRVLQSVYENGAPVSGEINVVRCDGTIARIYGWITRCANERGQEEFQSVCMDVTEKYKTEKADETQRYLKALTEVYDKIFEYNFANKTVKCLYGQNSNVFKPLENIPMNIREATEQWIENAVFEEDVAQVRAFFDDLIDQRLFESDGKPPQIKYRAMSSGGEIKTYSGVFLKIDGSVSLFCCRGVADDNETHTLRSENVSLRSMNENMQELVMRFTDGIVAFEISDDSVKPLYASDNVCQFFGYTKDEWVQMAHKSHSIKTFVSKSRVVSYEKIMELLKNGEAEFEYTDVETRSLHRIKAVCSHMFADADSPQYVMLYNAKDDREEQGEDFGVYIRTFGYFDVFVDGKPIAFRNEKSKELFALLVDRRGGYISSEEAISFLWEDEPASSVTLARYRKVALRLKNILEEYGISDVVESVNGRRRIVMDKVRCDLYDYLSQKEEFSQLFKGSYLTNYSWGETTLGELLGEHAF